MLALPRSRLRELDIEQINLSWTERELPQRLRTKHVHGLHPYLGKFIPQLVEIFLWYHFEPGQRGLDPFVGSGTTLVEANVLGIHSVGIDISEFNCLLSRVKTAKYDLMLLRKEIFNVLERVKQTVSPQPSLQLPLLPSIQEKTAEYMAASEYSERAKASYIRNMVEVFRNLLPYIREGGVIIFIVNDKFGLYDEIISTVGLRLEKRITRQVSRRTGRRSSEFGEDILIMRKKD